MGHLSFVNVKKAVGAGHRDVIGRCTSSTASKAS